jgi:hypothetical protein
MVFGKYSPFHFAPKSLGFVHVIFRLKVYFLVNFDYIICLLNSFYQQLTIVLGFHAVEMRHVLMRLDFSIVRATEALVVTDTTAQV